MNEEKQYTKKQKDKLLLANGWEKLTGWGMGYEAPESDNIIITVEEVRKWIGTEARDYYLQYGFDNCVDLDDAWESFTDNIYSNNDCKTDEEMYTLIDKMLSEVN